MHGLYAKLAKAGRMNVGAFAEPPVETLRRHVSVAPYYEEDVRALADLVGVERVLMGSDFPHAEGLAEPIRFLDELKELSADETRLVMRENGVRLLRPWC
jgi:predicted TIM-barrel fold metal-dependent hydrolase